MTKLVLSAFALVFSFQSSSAAQTLVASVEKELGDYLAPALAGQQWQLLLYEPRGDENATLLREAAQRSGAFGGLWIDESDGGYRLLLVEARDGEVHQARLPSEPQNLSGVTFASIATSLVDEARYEPAVVVRVEVNVTAPPTTAGAANSVADEASALPPVTPRDEEEAEPTRERPREPQPVRFDLSASLDGWLLANLKLGDGRWHVIGSIGVLPFRTQSLSLGGGFGGTFSLGESTYLNLEAQLSYVRNQQFSGNRERFANERPEFLGQLRVALGYRINSRWALLGGVGLATSASYRMSTDGDSRAPWAAQYYREADHDVIAIDRARWRAAVWPLLFVGVEIW